MKGVGGLKKPGISFNLNSLFLMFQVCQISCQTLNLKKIEVPKLMRDLINFITKGEYSIRSSFFTCYTAQTQIFFFFIKYTINP